MLFFSLFLSLTLILLFRHFCCLANVHNNATKFISRHFSANRLNWWLCIWNGKTIRIRLWCRKMKLMMMWMPVLGCLFIWKKVNNCKGERKNISFVKKTRVFNSSSFRKFEICFDFHSLDSWFDWIGYKLEEREKWFEILKKMEINI